MKNPTIKKNKYHLFIDIIICVLITIGFFIDGISLPDLFFIPATYVWVFQDYIEIFLAKRKKE